MKQVVTVQEAVVGMSLAYLPREAANLSLIEVYKHAPLTLPKMRDHKSLTLSWRSFSTWGRERVISCFTNKGGQYLSYDYLKPIATQITQNVRPKIIDAPLMLISRMGQGACLSIF